MLAGAVTPPGIVSFRGINISSEKSVTRSHVQRIPLGSTLCGSSERCISMGVCRLAYDLVGVPISLIKKCQKVNAFRHDLSYCV